MNNLPVGETVLKNLLSEMKRGDIVLAVLVLLEEPDYGYSLLKQLQEKGLEITQDTLYPLLRRLESQGLIKGGWKTTGSRPRKVFCTTDECKTLKERLIREWKKQKTVMEELL